MSLISEGSKPVDKLTYTAPTRSSLETFSDHSLWAASPTSVCKGSTKPTRLAGRTTCPASFPAMDLDKLISSSSKVIQSSSSMTQTNWNVTQESTPSDKPFRSTRSRRVLPYGELRRRGPRNPRSISNPGAVAERHGFTTNT